MRDDATRKKLLQTRTLDLAKAIDICRSSEATTRHLKAMATPDELHALQQRAPETRQRSSSRHRRGKSRGRQTGNRPPSTDRRDNGDRRCKFCDRTHAPSKSQCKAFGATCASCGKKNHFASVCRSKPPNDVCESLTEDSLLSLNSASDKRWYSNILVNGHEVRFLIDTGSTANVIPMSIVASLGKRKSDLRPSRSTLSMFDRTELRTVGELPAKLTHPRTRVELDVDFYVAETAAPVLGVEACRRLDIVRIVDENICEAYVSQAESTQPPPGRPVPAPRNRPATSTGRITEDFVTDQYADLFDGRLGLLEGDVHLETDPSVPPVQMPLRRLPVALRDRVETELRKLVADEVIAPVTKPTKWVSALLVTTKKDGGLRLCIDPKPLNRALQRSTYYMPTIDDVLPKLANAKVFSTVDAKSAFWMLKLDEQSSYLTTFETPFGRFRWLRCCYGISPAPEIFQARMHAALSGLNGVHCIADDILVAGSGDTVADAERDHDRNLLALLDRCRQKGIKLNRSKLCLRRESTRYMGHLLTSSGLRPDPRKTAAIMDMPIPEDRKALQRALGMATYLARFCPNFSEITAPLRSLLHDGNEFRWDIRHTEAFDRMKAMLATEPVLAYYSPDKELTCQADCSQFGMGCVIMQEGKVIEYASRALTKAEVAYAQIEKELLSIVHCLSRFDTYCYARHVVIETDHRPLLAIYKKALAASPKRLQRMWLRLQRYDFELVFRPSGEMIMADTLSRAFSPGASEGTAFPEEVATLSTVDEDQMAELKMVASANTIAAINAAAQDDDEYAGLIDQIRRGWPETAAGVATYLRPFHTFADELSVSSGLVFKGHRLVVPRQARAAILERLHAAHTGVNACLRRARETVYWPGITADIKRAVVACDICARHHQSIQKEPLMSHPAPSRPWEKVGIDIFTFADTDYLITVDYLTGWFEIDRLGAKSVSNIVYCLRQHFARQGLPLETFSDNSPFASAEFRRFAERYEFRHTTSSPRYSQSNGRVENAVKTAKRIMIKAHETNTDPFLALLEWRNTPSEQLGPSPAQLILGRRTRTRLPIADKLLDTATSAAASSALSTAKERQAAYYNRGAKERQPLSKGDTVRVKFDEKSDWRKAEVANVLPHRSYEVRFDDGTIRRRTSKHVRFSSEPPIIVDDDSPPPNSKGPTPAARLNAPPPAAPTSTHQIVTTRSGRVVRRPARYTD